jgi:hypothetical protein
VREVGYLVIEHKLVRGTFQARTFLERTASARLPRAFDDVLIAVLEARLPGDAMYNGVRVAAFGDTIRANAFLDEEIPPFRQRYQGSGPLHFFSVIEESETGHRRLVRENLTPQEVVGFFAGCKLGQSTDEERNTLLQQLETAAVGDAQLSVVAPIDGVANVKQLHITLMP